jgi:ABC-type polar amino acid transport system ATPase subunit
MRAQGPGAGRGRRRRARARAFSGWYARQGWLRGLQVTDSGKQADVLVFDEATSALDNETESAVMQAIEALGRELTIIIVAHRLSTLSGCDTVITISAGQANVRQAVQIDFQAEADKVAVR